MNSEERLAKLFSKNNVSFSIETLEDTRVLITISRKHGQLVDSVGGTYTEVEEGINDCIDKLDEMARKRANLQVVK